MNRDGNWKPYNADYRERNIREVFKSGDIGRLTKGTYDFIIRHMGFIAHYDLYGFQCQSDLGSRERATRAKNLKQRR